MATDKPRLQRQAMCDRLAMEFQNEWIVNLGVGNAHPLLQLC